MIKVYPSILKGEIQAPASKAHAMRLLVAAALSNTPTTITNIPSCTDIDTLLQVLKDLGCRLEISGESRLTVTVKPFSKNVMILDNALNFGESGAVARIITACMAALGIQATCRAEGKMLQRDQKQLTIPLALRGAAFSSFSYPFTVSGRLKGGDYQMSGESGSQFISALLMALPLVWEDSTITLTSPVGERSYINITLEILAQFGIKIQETETGFFIPGKQKYKTPKKATVCGDWQLSVMWIIAGGACERQGGSVKVHGLDGTSKLALSDYKKAMALLAQQYSLCGISCKESPELLSLYACLAAAHGGKTVIYDIPEWFKQSDSHLRAIVKCLQQFDTQFESAEGVLVVNRKSQLLEDPNRILDCDGDAMSFMAFVVGAGLAGVPVLINNEHAADKTYRAFLSDFAALGGQYEIV